MPFQPAVLEKIIITAARQELLPRFARVERREKRDGSFLTAADMAMQERVARELRAHWPDTVFLGEEMETAEQARLLTAGQPVWCLDPLDGTSNYLHGMPHFGISIALQVSGRVEHGVVYDPMRDEMFTASRGNGAYLNNTRIRVSARPSLENAVIATAFPFRLRGMMPVYTGIFADVYRKIEDIRRNGAACLDLAWVANGRFDAFFEIGLKSWDVAAGALLVREAGGVVSDFDGNDAVENSHSILAAPFKLMTPLRGIIEPRWAKARR